ncbi:hypothetical protein F5Y04DRAFT_257446 [Hypomontagnella monticulosa]|nr:hypothetical protein F5Y04DRAFT_257446 [Hypomontagnella monticulosa]
MQQALPFVQVRDLPSSASFYSAITQPLKLRYISANSSSIVFGDTASPTPDPVLEVRRLGAGQPLRPSRLVLSAQSPSVVAAFRAAALRAYPEVPIDIDSDNRVEITDFDGNRVEVVCNAPHRYSSNYERSVTAASSVSPREPRTVMRRSATTPMETQPRSSSSSRGFGTGAALGSVLGAAAVGVAVGGALTYAMMSRDRQRAPRQEYDAQPTALQRRASYPDPAPINRPKYIEEYSPRKYPPQSFGARYAQIEAPPRSRALEDIDDRASRHSSHYSTGSKARRRSEASTARRPLMITDAEHMSEAPSKYTAAGPRLLTEAEYRSQSGSDDRHSRAPSKYTATPSRYGTEKEYHRSRESSRHRTPRPVESETFVSALSKRSASTVRAPPPRTPDAKRHGRSRANSYMSARDMPLPESRANWNGDDDDDVESIAPSDSISCVGDSGYSTRKHRRGSHTGGTPSMVGRYQNVLHEFDGKRRPLYGSEHNY